MPAAHNDITERGYKLPHPDNLIFDETNPADGDVMRLRDTISAISDDVDGLELAVMLGLPV